MSDPQPSPQTKIQSSAEAAAFFSRQDRYLGVWLALAEASDQGQGVDTYAVAALCGAVVGEALGAMGPADTRRVRQRVSRDLLRAQHLILQNGLLENGPLEGEGLTVLAGPWRAPDDAGPNALVTPERLETVRRALARLDEEDRAPGPLCAWLVHQAAVQALSVHAAGGDGAGLLGLMVDGIGAAS